LKIICLYFIVIILAECKPPPSTQELFNYTQEIRIEHGTSGIDMVATFRKDTATDGKGEMLPDEYLVFVDDHLLEPEPRLNSYFGYVSKTEFANKSHTVRVSSRTGSTITEFPFTFRLLELTSPFPTVIDNKGFKLAVSGMEDGDSVNFVFANPYLPPTYFRHTVQNDSIIFSESDINTLKPGLYKVYMNWGFSQILTTGNKKAGTLLAKSEMSFLKVEVK
jgi:hypothetical protein